MKRNIRTEITDLAFGSIKQNEEFTNKGRTRTAIYHVLLAYDESKEREAIYISEQKEQLKAKPTYKVELELDKEQDIKNIPITPKYGNND